MAASISVISAISCWLILFMLVPLLRRRLLDHPNSRSSHKRPTPRGGGVAFVLVAVLSNLIPFHSNAWSPIPTLTLVAIPLALIGLLDDCFNLPSGLRYVIQLLTALGLLYVSPLIVDLKNNIPFFAILITVAVFLLIIVTAIINFTNFMDGIDGLVAGCMTVTLTCAALHLSASTPLWAYVGALIGFLLWNWSPARVFMGDVGSTFLGAVFAGVVLQTSTWTDAFGLLLVATPLLGDAGLCIPRRLFAGQPVFQSHRLHLFQRLHQAGWTHAGISRLYITATAMLALAFLLDGWLSVICLAVVIVLIGLWLDQYIAVSFATASKG